MYAIADTIEDNGQTSHVRRSRTYVAHLCYLDLVAQMSNTCYPKTRLCIQTSAFNVESGLSTIYFDMHHSHSPAKPFVAACIHSMKTQRHIITHTETYTNSGRTARKNPFAIQKRLNKYQTSSHLQNLAVLVHLFQRIQANQITQRGWCLANHSPKVFV
jgi:hypothetical protein